MWSKDEIEIRDDGFLYVVNTKIDLVDEEEEQQPLLLHSTESLLQMLYPSLSKESILNPNECCGHYGHLERKLMKNSNKKYDGVVLEEENEEDTEMEDAATKTKDNDVIDDNVTVGREDEEAMDVEDVAGGEKDESNKEEDTIDGDNNQKTQKIPPQYEIYQNLVRCNNLSAYTQSALLDIRLFRHRNRKEENRYGDGEKRMSREEQKVRALEAQQQKLLSKQQSQDASNGKSDDDGNDNDNNDDEVVGVGGDVHRESQTIKIARTINSIRALYPHLLPLFNHPRRNDKELFIKKVQYKSKRRAMCWILGTKVFDTTTCKLWSNIHDDAKILLGSFVPMDVANVIMIDPLGLGGSTTQYWQNHFALDVLRKSKPKILNPIQILADRQDTDFSREEVLEVSKRCDQDLCSHVMETVNKSKIQKQYDRAVDKFHKRLTNVLTRYFPGARVSIYGSCLSNLSLGEGADVDISVWTSDVDKLKTKYQNGTVSASKYEKSIKNLAFGVSRKLERMVHEFSEVYPVTRARVPVVKGKYNNAENPYSSDGSIHFDICFLNDIAVANSGLLREYSLVDPRVRGLMMTVKQWAKEHKFNSAKDNYISSYAWVNLVIFYVQCLGLVPNLQNEELMAAVNVTPDTEGNYWHFVNKLHTCTLTWEELNRANVWSPPDELQEVTISALLYGFFEFYSCRFPSAAYAVSIKEGGMTLLKINQRKMNLFLCIEDPFETFDSHCPHDLGTPAGEKGARDMLHYLEKEEVHLRKMLCGETGISSLWPEPPFIDPHESGGNRKTGQYTRFVRKVDNDDDRNKKKANPPASKGRGGLFAKSNDNKVSNGNPSRGNDGRNKVNKPRGGDGNRGKPKHHSHHPSKAHEGSTQPAGENSGQQHDNKQNQNHIRTRKGKPNENNRNLPKRLEPKSDKKGQQGQNSTNHPNQLKEEHDGETKKKNRNRNQRRRERGKLKAKQQSAESSNNDRATDSGIPLNPKE